MRRIISEKNLMQADITKVEHLKEELKTLEDRERRKEEEVRKLTTEKNELQADLVKRDRSFLELEESVFRLELAKESAEKDRGRWEGEVRDREKEADALRKEIEEYKESSRHLKEIVVTRERSLQDKASHMTRLTNERDRLKDEHARLHSVKSHTETRMKEQTDRLNQLEEELHTLREEVQQHKRWKEECRIMKEDREREEVERNQMKTALTERENKLQKRDKQVTHVLEQYRKLEGAYSKLRSTLKSKTDSLKSKERQVEYLNAMATCSSQEEKNNLMKELVKELVATQRQVEDLLSRMEGGSIPTVRVETSASSLTPDKGTVSTTTTIQHSPHGASLSGASMSGASMSGASLNCLSAPMDPLSINSDLRSLFAVYKLTSHESLKKQAGETLVTLSGVEVRLSDRMAALKVKPLAESVEYSTLREASLGLANLRVCVQEVLKIVATAWITELPPVDGRGNFYDPVMDGENQALQREVTRLTARTDVLEHTIRQQQSRLDTNKERQKNWEASMYRQLYKTTNELEQAKENIETFFDGADNV